MWQVQLACVNSEIFSFDFVELSIQKIIPNSISPTTYLGQNYKITITRLNSRRASQQYQEHTPEFPKSLVLIFFQVFMRILFNIQ